MFSGQTLPQKGVTLFPHTNKNPPVVKVRGLSLDSEEGRAALYEVLPTAKRYYAQQAHYFSLSIIEQHHHRIRTQAGDVIQVTFSGGQEYVNIHLAPRAPGTPLVGYRPSIVCVPVDLTNAPTGWGNPYTDENIPLGTVDDGTYSSSPYVRSPGIGTTEQLQKRTTLHTGLPSTFAEDNPEAYGTKGAWANGGYVLSWSDTYVFYRGEPIFHFSGEVGNPIGTNLEIFAAVAIEDEVHVFLVDTGDDAYRVLSGVSLTRSWQGTSAVLDEDFYLAAELYATEVTTSNDVGRGWATISPGGTKVVGLNNAAIFRASLVDGTWELSEEAIPEPTTEYRTYTRTGSIPAPETLSEGVSTSSGTVVDTDVMPTTVYEQQIGVVWDGEEEQPVIATRTCSYTATNTTTGDYTYTFIPEFSPSPIAKLENVTEEATAEIDYRETVSWGDTTIETAGITGTYARTDIYTLDENSYDDLHMIETSDITTEVTNTYWESDIHIDPYLGLLAHTKKTTELAWNEVRDTDTYAVYSPSYGEVTTLTITADYPAAYTGERTVNVGDDVLLSQMYSYTPPLRTYFTDQDGNTVYTNWPDRPTTGGIYSNHPDLEGYYYPVGDQTANLMIPGMNHTPFARPAAGATAESIPGGSRILMAVYGQANLILYAGVFTEEPANPSYTGEPYKMRLVSELSRALYYAQYNSIPFGERELTYSAYFSSWFLNHEFIADQGEVEYVWFLSGTPDAKGYFLLDGVSDTDADLLHLSLI